MLGPVSSMVPVPRGYTHNERAIAAMHSGGSVFVKGAVDEVTAEWLRREHLLYEALAGVPFVPHLVAWKDGERPLLVLEDLSGATWPPPWDTGQVAAVLAMLEDLARQEPPAGLPALSDDEAIGEGWPRVLADPREFLALDLCTEEWLGSAGPVLAEAADAAPLGGTSLVHGDVRSDNICLRAGSALIVDWNLATIGNAQVDMAFWLPSLAAEGGPDPEAVFPGCPPELAAHVAGFFASRAGQPIIAHAPLVRKVQLDQLRHALPWAARILGLPPPDRGSAP
jgi:Phosphotransferase enzyme family